MADQNWVLLNASGAIAAQIITDGQTPAEEGSNPDGLSEVKVDRRGDLMSEELVDGAWQPLLSAAKAAKLSALGTVADQKLNFWKGGSAPSGGLQVDDVSTGRMTSRATQAIVCKAMGSPFDLAYWIMLDNSHRPISGPDDFLTFATAADGYKTAAILNNSALKTSIGAAADLATLDAIDVNSGWPS